MSDELKGQLEKHGLGTLTILFDDTQSYEDLGEFGEVVCLNDVCD